jgi:flagellar export protein FliJ
MAFHFSLAAVLRVRVIVEEREEGRLQKILFDISKVFDDLERIDTQIEEADNARHAEVLKPCIGLDVQACYGGVKELKQCRKDLEDKIQKLEEARDKQLATYEAARRNREMLTDMREKKRTAYEVEMNKREQKTLDDNFISRRGRG